MLNQWFPKSLARGPLQKSSVQLRILSPLNFFHVFIKHLFEVQRGKIIQ